MKTTGDQQLVKRINRSVLLRLLRSQPGRSRAQLANHSGLTKSTVSLLVRELIDEGWLSETSLTAANGVGRPSTPLQIDTRSRGLIGGDRCCGQRKSLCAAPGHRRSATRSPT
jgi:predicted ArsR family transcriptional regulator